MSNLKGINVSSTIVPYTTDDKFATHDSIYGKGGFKSVTTITELYQIPEERITEGMLVFVKDDADKKYFYQFLDGEWKAAEIGKGTTVSSSEQDLEEFEQFGNPGDITYSGENQSFYTIVINPETGERELQKLELDTYDINELETINEGKFNILLNNSDNDFATSSNNIFVSDGKLYIPSGLNIGTTTILPGEIEEDNINLQLPEKSGTIALKQDVEDHKDEVDELLKTVDDKLKYIYDENNLKVVDNENYYHYYIMSRDNVGYASYSEGYGYFFTLNYFANPSSYSKDPKNHFILLYVTGYYTDSYEISGNGNSHETRLFSDIISISAGHNNFNGGNRVQHLNSSLKNIFWFTDDTDNRVLTLCVPHHVELHVKVLSKSIPGSIEDLDFKDNPLYKFEEKIEYLGETRPDNFKPVLDFSNSEFYESEIERINKEIEKVPTVLNLDYYSNDPVKDTINVDQYNTFVINSNNYEVGNEEGKFILTVEESEDIYQKSFKFIFLSPNNFKHFQLVYNNEVVLKLNDLEIKDGEGIYVTPTDAASTSPDKSKWSYYIEESGLPNHDETIKVVTYDNKPALSVPQVENKLYRITSDTQRRYSKTGDKSNPYLEKRSGSDFALYVPKDTRVIYIQCDEALFNVLGTNSVAISRVLPIENEDFLDNHEIGIKLDLQNSNDQAFGILTTNTPENNVFFAMSTSDGTGWDSSSRVFKKDLHYLHIKRVQNESDPEIKTWYLIFKDTKDTGTTDSPISDSDINNLLTKYFGTVFELDEENE